MKQKLFVTFILPLAAVAFGSSSQQIQQTSASLDDVVSRHLEARGGLAKLKQLQSVIYRFRYQEGEYINDDAVFALMRPYFKLVGDPEHPSKDYREGFDGGAWEYFGDPGIVVRTVGAPAAAIRHHSWVEGPFLDYREKQIDLTLEGAERIGEHNAYRIRLRFQDGFEEFEFIDTETFRWIASRKIAPIHAYGKKVETETRWSDFRSVDGIQFAFKSQEVEIKTGKILNETTTKQIEINKKLKASAFSPPVLEKNELQQFLDQLFIERSDPEAVLWSYTEFRRAHRDINTDVGVQVIGYQMLKTGAVESSVELLTRNAADYPGSAGAAFGLARALEHSGKFIEARSEYQRALQLDPNHKRAKEALERFGGCSK